MVFNDFMMFLQSFAMTYLVWISLHYACSHLYVEYCAPKGIIGFIYSPFMTPMPHCVAMRWVVYNGGKIIEVMWFMTGKWAVEKLVFPNKINYVKHDYSKSENEENEENEEKKKNRDDVPEEVPEKLF